MILSIHYKIEKAANGSANMPSIDPFRDSDPCWAMTTGKWVVIAPETAKRECLCPQSK